MNRFTKLLFALCLVPVVAFSQATNTNWTFQGTVPADTSMYTGYADVHGLAVDADGNVYVQPYYPTLPLEVTLKDINGDDSTGVKNFGAIYVFSPDGVPTDTIAFSNEAVGDTLGGTVVDGAFEWMSGRGMRYNAVNGYLYAVFYNSLYKIDLSTGLAVAKTTSEGGSAAAPAFDGEGNVYLAPVVGANAAIKKYDADLNYIEDVGAPGQSFSRSLEVDEDGTVYWAGYTNGYVLKYARPDEFSPYQATPDTVLRGIKAESFTFHPSTGRLWVSAGSPNDLPGESPLTGYAYNINTWYAFNVDDLGTSAELPVDSLAWTVAEGDTDLDGRARAMAWTAEGTTVYIAQFNQSAPSVQKLTGTPQTVSNEQISSLPNGYVLKGNYPNPFNPTTNIEFTLASAGKVQMNVYDLLGRQVATIVNRNLSSGTHTVQFDASRLSSGTYLYVLEVNGVRLTNKMTLIK